ncbi:hypothetical protein EJB05_56192, partial [Eragrostis curvula]
MPTNSSPLADDLGPLLLAAPTPTTSSPLANDLGPLLLAAPTPTTSSPLADDLGSAPPRRPPGASLLLVCNVPRHDLEFLNSVRFVRDLVGFGQDLVGFCYKQPPDSVHCGYYTCWFARSSSKYLDRVVELSKRDMEEIRKKRQQKKVLPSKPGSTSLSKYFDDADDLAIKHRQLCLWCGSRQPYEPEDENTALPLEELDEDLPPIDE